MISSAKIRVGANVPSPIVDSRGGSRRTNEVDAVRNPTTLFRKINSGNWDGALDALHKNPVEASVWISRRNSEDDGLAWKYLPLHLICLQQRPPRELLLALLQFHPQAASLLTPHDGNLPIHYICESGCEDEYVFGALLASFPPCLEVKNFKEKTPLLICHAKSRGILMKVLRQRQPLPLNNGQQQQQQQNTQDKDKNNRRKGAERRNDIDTSWKAKSSRERRQRSHLRVPQSTPARYRKYNRSTFDEGGEPSAREHDLNTPKASKNRSSRRRAKNSQSPFFGSSSSGDAEEDTDTAAYISSKTTELARSALNYLYPSYEDQRDPHEQRENDSPDEHVRSPAKEKSAQQQIIDELTKKVDRLTHSAESSTEASKLCERILAKAEADNVAFRTQIQKLMDEKEEMKAAAVLKEKANKKCFDQMRKVLWEKGSGLNVDVFGGGSSVGAGMPSSGSCSSNDDKDQIPEALRTVLSLMDERNVNLHSTIGRLEADLSKSEVALKIVKSKNQIFRGEKDAHTKSYHELERKATILEEEKDMLQNGLGDLKDRVSTLTVINQSLQEQVDSMSNSQVKQENDQFQSELNRLKAQLVQMKEEKESMVQLQFDHQRAVEMEEKLGVLSQRNRTLKDTLLVNNEKYSEKVQELSEKYSSLERANEHLRRGLEKSSNGCGDRSESDVRLHLQGDNKLLYEV